MDEIANRVTHICLMGDDPSANITPLVDSDIDSQRLIIAHDKSQKVAAEALEAVARTRGHRVDKWILPSCQSTDAIKLSFLRLFELETNSEIETQKKSIGQERSSEVWLNASNGNRQQVLSAYEIARSYRVPIFIVEPNQDELCWIYPEQRASVAIKDKIKLHEFFTVNSCRLVSQKNKQGIPKNLRALGKRWLDKAAKIGSGLTKLNHLGFMAKAPEYTSVMDKAMLLDHSLQWLLDDLQSNDLIEIHGKKIKFRDSNILFFCTGGWLEEITYGFVRGLAGNHRSIQDNGHSVEVERAVKGKTVLNELDVVALVNNRLFVIECKTKRFTKGDGNNTLYKLDSIAERLGGIKANAALVTFFPISAAESRRARELNIEIIGSDDLPQLENRLAHWLVQ